jgi:hypothetical protein
MKMRRNSSIERIVVDLAARTITSNVIRYTSFIFYAFTNNQCNVFWFNENLILQSLQKETEKYG